MRQGNSAPQIKDSLLEKVKIELKNITLQSSDEEAKWFVQKTLFFCCLESETHVLIKALRNEIPMFFLQDDIEIQHSFLKEQECFMKKEQELFLQQSIKHLENSIRVEIEKETQERIIIRR